MEAPPMGVPMEGVPVLDVDVPKVELLKAVEEPKPVDALAGVAVPAPVGMEVAAR